MRYIKLIIILGILIPLTGCLEKNLIKTPENETSAKQLIDSLLKANKKLIKDNQLINSELRECYKNSEGRDDRHVLKHKIEYRDTCYKSLIHIEKGAKLRFKKSDNLQLVLNYQSVIDSLKIQNAKILKEKSDQVAARSRENLLLKSQLSNNQQHKSNWLLYVAIGFVCCFLIMLIFSKLKDKLLKK